MLMLNNVDSHVLDVDVDVDVNAVVVDVRVRVHDVGVDIDDLHLWPCSSPCPCGH